MQKKLEKKISLHFSTSTFPKLYVLLKLQRNLFAPSNLGIFNCESCDYSCENKQTFDNHVTRTHNPKNVVVKKRVWKKRIKGHFKCAHCPWTGSVESIQDFLIKLDMKPFMYASSGNKYFFTKSCHRQTYQNYE